MCVHFFNIDPSRFLIISTKNLSYYANFTHEVRIIRPNKLKLLKKNIKAFVKELKRYEITDIVDDTLQHLLDIHKLNLPDLVGTYSEQYYHNTK